LEALKMPFFISPVDPRITPGFEVMLSPGPTVCEYPGEQNGEKIETPDGRVIVQQPSNDARLRSWTWRGYPGSMPQYEKQYILIQTFRSRYRQELGQLPYVWVKDSVTKRLRKKSNVIATVAGSGSTTTVLSMSPAVTVVSDPVIEILASTFGGTGTGVNQIRNVSSMTTTTITCPAFATIPHGAKVKLTGWTDDWFRARVLDVSRKLKDDGGNIRFDTTLFTFVIEDSSYNDLG
jgi:hypothetical protein